MSVPEQVDGYGFAKADLPPITVLLAEDEEFSMKLEKSVLGQLGIKDIITAYDGEDARIILEQEVVNIDLVISDLYMPKMDGIELLRVVREKRPELPFLLLTSETSSDAVRTAQELGVDGYIIKPFSPAKVDKTISAILARRRPELADVWLRSADRRQFDDAGHPQLKRLYKYWHDRRGAHSIPSLSDLMPLHGGEAADILPQMVLATLQHNPFRVRYEHVGDNLAKTIGRHDLVGKYVDEQPFWFRKYAEPAYRSLVKDRVPQFKYLRTIESFMIVKYQRLLLPLSDDNSRVDHVIGGMFDMRTVKS